MGEVGKLALNSSVVKNIFWVRSCSFKVHVYYTGKLANNREFDSCRSGKAFSFKLGKGDVIKGWETGIQGMRVGGKRRLVIPPGQGYGSTRMGDIPPNSTLYFDVELKAVS
ncbi:46 kDa FK506-binding nuclear protein isoform X3 [Ixodes scapularis]